MCSCTGGQMLDVFNVGAISKLPWHSLDVVLAAASGWVIINNMVGWVANVEIQGF